MRINWKLRLKNKPTLVALIGIVVAFVYQMLALFGITPPISESDVVNTLGVIINILAGLGIVVDPTTKGTGDSDEAMMRVRPKEVR